MAACPRWPRQRGGHIGGALLFSIATAAGSLTLPCEALVLRPQPNHGPAQCVQVKGSKSYDYDPKLSSCRYWMYHAVFKRYPSLLPDQGLSTRWIVMFPIGEWGRMYYFGPQDIPFGGASKIPGADENLSCYGYRAGQPVLIWSIWLREGRPQRPWLGTLGQYLNGRHVVTPIAPVARADLADTRPIAAYTFQVATDSVSHRFESDDESKSFYEPDKMDLAWPDHHKRLPVGYLEWQAMSSKGDAASRPRARS